LGLAPLPAPTVLGFVGQGVRRLLGRSLEASGCSAASPLLDRAVEVFTEIYGDGLLVATRPYPGVEAVLRDLASRGVVLSLLTNKSSAFSAAILRGLGLEALFRAAVTGDGDLPRKPAPDGATFLVRASGLPASLALIVGDSPEDLETARAAGIASCAVTWGFRSRDELAQARPDHQVSRPEELLGLAWPG